MRRPGLPPLAIVRATWPGRLRLARTSSTRPPLKGAIIPIQSLTIAGVRITASNLAHWIDDNDDRGYRSWPNIDADTLAHYIADVRAHRRWGRRAYGVARHNGYSPRGGANFYFANACHPTRCGTETEFVGTVSVTRAQINALHGLLQSTTSPMHRQVAGR